MRNRVLVLLIVLAVLAVSGLSMANAQESAMLKALTVEAVTLVAEPNADAEVVAELPVWTEVMVLGTNNAGDWLEVEAADGAGYAPLSSFLVLNLSAMAPQVVVETNRAGATALFATPSLSSEYVGEATDGTVATLLGVYEGEWAYVELADGSHAWSIASAWVSLADAEMVLVTTSRTDELGVFVEPSVGADVAGTIPNGEVVYRLSVVDDAWSEVLLADGSTAYAISANLEPFSGVMLETEVRRAQAGIYAEPDQTAELVTALDNGITVMWVADVDEFWVEVYHPLFGTGYGLKVNFSNPFFVAENQTDDAVVRAGPSSATEPGIAQIAAGTEVLITGVNEDGTWVKVAIPFSEVDFPQYGVDGWMAEFLFQDNVGELVFDKDLLGVAE